MLGVFDSPITWGTNRKLFTEENVQVVDRCDGKIEYQSGARGLIILFMLRVFYMSMSLFDTSFLFIAVKSFCGLEASSDWQTYPKLLRGGRFDSVVN